MRLVRQSHSIQYAALRGVLSVLGCAFALMPAQAAADQSGAAGKAVQLTINTLGSEKYASFHGSVSIRQTETNVTEIYYWGGSSCPAQKISDAQVQLLADALVHRSRTLVSPIFREGQGPKGTRCLVAFDLVATS